MKKFFIRWKQYKKEKMLLNYLLLKYLYFLLEISINMKIIFQLK